MLAEEIMMEHKSDTLKISNTNEIEEALRKSEQRFHAFFDHSRIGMAITSVDKKWIEVNDRLCEILGYSSQELSCMTWAEITHPDDLAEQEVKFNRVLSGETDEYEMEKRFIHRDGHLVYTHLASHCIRDDEGSIDYFVTIIEDITERKASEAKMVESESRMRAIIENEPECIKIIDEDGILIEMNPAGLAMIEADSLDQVSGHPVLDVIAPEFRSAYSKLLDKVMAGERVQMEYEVLGLHGGRRLLETHAVPMMDNGKKIHLAITRDISERKKAEEKLHLAASVFIHAREAIVITSANGTIIDVNDAFSRITGYNREEVLGKNPRILSSRRQGKKFYAAMWRDLIDLGHWYGEIWNRRKNGEIYAEMLTISSILDPQGKIQYYVALFSDITEFKEHERHLERVAHYDALTALPNRTLLADRMKNAIAQAFRRQQPLAVVYLDLDGFKNVNDTHGHEVGDQLLISLSARMGHTLRQGDTLARLGGDEFVAVLIDLENTEASIPLINRLLSAASDPVSIGDLTLKISASLGVTFYPQSEEVDADQLLRQADNAMYQAKLSGKNCYHIFDTEQDRNIRGQHESVERIRLALNREEFLLYYQPKVNMRTGKVIGAEALIRWQHPQEGLLAPAVFLPIIENHPLAIELGEWVINTALRQLEIWQGEGLDIPVSVNIGARQLQKENFVRRLRGILGEHPSIKPSCLELEILETSALEDINRASQVIAECRELGVTFALDDFGTGYSSLTYLRRLPITLLKIDQSFIRDMLIDPDDLAILEGVIGLAGAFRREVIAEGVETIEHGEILLQLGCEFAQGYGIARPMPSHELPKWVNSWSPDPAWAEVPSSKYSDLPLLYAGVEHRAWVSATEMYLRGEREALVPQDHHQCRFGTWLDTEGLAQYGESPPFKAIQPIHQQIHKLASELLDLHAQGEHDVVMNRLSELHHLREDLLAQLKLLAKINHPRS
jgi:diguanylate cyclase (GGDEF)-like protein/PAS domain S-box-containing protein